MKIDGMNNNINMGMQTRAVQGMDATSKSIRNQIQAKQQELQRLSENENLSPEEKMKKRQEIQQEISNLNMQLRQHEIKLRREQQQSEGKSCDNMSGGKQSVSEKAGSRQNADLPQATMKSIISADSSMKQARVQGNVAEQNEGRAGILKSEIKLDSARGGDTHKKEEELAKIEQKASDATAAQMNTLSAANKKMEEASEADRESDKAESLKTEDAKKEDEKQKNIAENDEQDIDAHHDRTRESDVHVDVRL